MLERDMIAEIIANFGPPQDAQRVPAEVAEAYRGRVPDAMIDFWRTYGWGSYNDGDLWICDPAPFAPVLARVFAGDPEFHAEDMTVIAYDSFSYTTIWNRNGYEMQVDYERSQVFRQPEKAFTNPETGKPFSKDFLVGWAISSRLNNDAGFDYFKLACEKLGNLRRGKIFGYAPLLQLGGAEDLDNLHRLEATVYMDMIAQLGPFTLVELTGPEPGAPMGRQRPVRRIGSQQ
jgi:hypothetical protein